MTKQRWLFVESYPHVIHGQQRTLLSLLGQCAGADIDPVVGVTAEGPLSEAVREQGVEAIVFPYPETLSTYGGAIYRYKGWRRARLYGQWIKYLFSLRRALKKLSLNGVFCNDMRGLLTIGVAARSLRLPVVIWDKLDKPHGWLDALQLPIALKNPVISQAVTVKYPEWQRKFFRRKIRCIPEGIDLSLFDKQIVPHSNLPNLINDLGIGIVGSITHRKGHDRIFSIFGQLLQKIPNLRLLIVGEISGTREDQDYYAVLREASNPRIHFLGQREDVPTIMRELQMLLVPSRHEGLGMVILEAMAARLPVIGARTGGIPEVIVDGETGLLFEGDDPEDLMRCIETLSASEDLRKAMGEAGRRRVEQRFNRTERHQEILNLCKSLV